MNKIQYYIDLGVTLMCRIECVTGQEMGELYPALETAFWGAVNAANKRHLIRITNDLAFHLEDQREAQGGAQ